MDTGEGRHWAAESLVPDQCLYLILIVNKQRPRGPPVTRSAAASKYFPRGNISCDDERYSEMSGTRQGMVTCLTSAVRFNVAPGEGRESPACLFVIDNTCTLWIVPLVSCILFYRLPSCAKMKTSCPNVGMPLHSGVKMSMSRRIQIRPRLKRPQYQGWGH